MITDVRFITSNDHTGTLLIEFNYNIRYRYGRVPTEKYKDLINSKCRQKYFIENIKDEYEFTLIELTENAKFMQFKNKCQEEIFKSNYKNIPKILDKYNKELPRDNYFVLVEVFENNNDNIGRYKVVYLEKDRIIRNI